MAGRASDIERAALIGAAWDDGILWYKLHQGQFDAYRHFWQSKSTKEVWNCARQFGKSYALMTIAFEFGRRIKNGFIKYGAPLKTQVSRIIFPLFREISADCPRKYRPVWRREDGGFYEFPYSDARMYISALNNGHAENLRGEKSHLSIIDEARDVRDLHYVVEDILVPQTTHTNGRIIIASTPPKTPAHDFCAYSMQAEIDDNYIKRTIYDNPLLTPSDRHRLCKEAGGVTSSTWRREYMCEFIVDPDYAIIPEFTDEKAMELVREMKRPDYFDAYVAMDIGFIDFTFVVFGYYDFKLGKGVIEDELVLKHMTTDEIAKGIREKEASLAWPKGQPYRRSSDTDLIVIHDLKRLHGIDFAPTAKDDAMGAINALRVAIAQNEIFINPRCKNLIAHLKYGVWDNSRKKFERDVHHGHFDGIHALVYWWRNVNKHRNPYPALRPGITSATHYVPEALMSTIPEQSLKNLAGIFGNKLYGGR